MSAKEENKSQAKNPDLTPEKDTKGGGHHKGAHGKHAGNLDDNRDVYRGRGGALP